jgi:transcriptional regulator with XRE-family HTH domain
MEPFSDWLEQQLKIQGMKVSELARAAGIQPASLSRVLSGTRNAGPDICLGLAQALDVPPEEVFRRAGLLPPKPEEAMTREKADYLFSRLSDEDQETILAMMHAFLQRRRKNAEATLETS